MTRLVPALLLVAAACSTRRVEPPPAPTPIEVRAPGGDLIVALGETGDGWELREAGAPAARVVRTEQGARVTSASGAMLAELGPGPADLRLVAGDKIYRVAFTKPRRAVVVLDGNGATVVAWEQTEKEAVARDSTTRQVGRARKDGERVVVEDGLAPAAIVTGLAAPADRELLSIILASKALSAPARAALFAHLLSR